MFKKSLKTLLEPWYQAPNIYISDLKLDHRELLKGDLFIAIQGHQFDARTLIPEAIAKGAVAVLADSDDVNASFSSYDEAGVPVVIFPQLKSKLSQIATAFYQNDNPIPVIGVTGTNGKTTITQLIAQWLDLLEKPTAVMGTTGNGFLQHLIPSANTTGSAVAIARDLAHFQQQNADYVAMEVSSHGLVQNRVSAVNFSAAVFSNLSRDHLDYHGTMEAYAEAKLRLFTHYNADIAVINADDPIGQKWLSTMPSAVAVSLLPLSLAKTQKGLWLTQVAYKIDGVHIQFDSSWGKGEFTAALVGEFNVMNLLLSLATLLSLGFDKKLVLAKASKLTPVIGRMEVFHKADKPVLVVDYAHTPDALEKALLALRQHCEGKLWCIFGCGGERDLGKRPMMAAIAEEHADYVILTNDNPRSEIPEQIVHHMLEGMKNAEKAKVIYERFEACAYAFAKASKKDLILIAGKGHEDYQIFAIGAVHYSDRETALTLLENI